MEALVVLVVLPLAIGIVAEFVFRDTTHASCAAVLACPLAVFISLSHLEPEGAMSWLATLLVSPFAIAFSLVAVLWSFGRMQSRKHDPGNES